jgi:hypothetical protein
MNNMWLQCKIREFQNDFSNKQKLEGEEIFDCQDDDCCSQPGRVKWPNI